MHERSLVKSLLRQIEEIAQRHRASQVTSVSVEIGPLSGVEAECVRLAYEELREGTCCEQALLVIEPSGLVIRCRECKLESQLESFLFRCECCGSGKVQLISGGTFRLLSITVQDSAEPHHV
jgi:hydrogenase nickel incorporation protein HypA/HybF